MSTAVSYEKVNDFAIVHVDNPPVNALSHAVRLGLKETIQKLENDADVKAVILKCAGRTFIAGADVKEFDQAPQPPHLPDVVALIENASKPWCALLHGNALGGGLEVALACRFRLAAPNTNLGTPEVTLGVSPGAGGIVRLTRLVGASEATHLVTSGRPIKADKALEIGLVDALVSQDPVEDAMTFLTKALHKVLPVSARDRTPDPVEPGFWQQQSEALAKKFSRETARMRSLKVLQAAIELDFEAASKMERDLFLDLRVSDQAAALRHVFFAERSAPRPKGLPDMPSDRISRVAVIGGGTMGAGIATALLLSNYKVFLVERNAEALAAGVEKISALLTTSVKKGAISEQTRDGFLESLGAFVDYAEIAEADMVIEAVFEDLHVKRDVFAKLDVVCRPDTVFATNTSYLDPVEIFHGVSHPDRLLGLHFFSPAHIMKLLEVIPTPHTSPEALSAAFKVAQVLRKIPVRAGICDGFIGNRILKVTRAQAERLLLAGLEPHEVDHAMREFGLPMGPFEAQDLGGLDIAAFQREAARSRGESPFAPVADVLCAEKRYGQKTGGGWYDYEPGSRTPLPSDHVHAVVSRIREDRPLTQATSLTASERADAIILPMVNEGAQILQEGIASDASAIDLVEIHGYGFPRWRGGLMMYAQQRGLSDVVQALNDLAAKGLAQAPCDHLQNLAQQGRWDDGSVM